MAEKEAKIDLDLLEDMQDEDVTLSSTELEGIIHSAEFTEEPGADEQQLEKYGVWVKVKPEPVSAIEPEDAAFQLSDLDSTREPGQDAGLSPKEEDLLAELDEELPLEEPPAGEPALEPLDDMELPDLDDVPSAPPSGSVTVAPAVTAEEDGLLEDLMAFEEEPPEDRAGETEAAPAGGKPFGAPMAAASPDIEVELNEQAGSSFEDLAALEEDLDEVKREAGPAIDSTGILQRIEHELEAIKSEIFDLKKELSGIGRATEAAPDVEVEPVSDEAKGFFDEEEDETIALTGDELDNILITADVTEETSAEAGAPAREAPAEEDLSAALELTPAELPEAPVVEAAELVDREDLIDLDAAAGIEAVEIGEARLAEELADAPEAGPENLEALPDELPPIPELPGEEPGLADGEITFEPPEPLDLDEAEEGPATDLAEEILLDEPSVLEASAEEMTLEEGDLDLPMPDAQEGTAEPPSETGSGLGLAEDLLTIEEEPPAPGNAAETDTADAPLDTFAEEELILEEEPSDAPSPETAEDAGPAELEGLEELEGIQLGAEEEGAVEGKEPGADLSEVGDLSPAEPVGRDDLAAAVPADLQSDLKNVLKYLDDLLEALPEEKIKEFARSDYFGTYRRLFKELGLEDGLAD